MGESTPASAVMLTANGTNDEARLSWTEAVPWLVDSTQVFKEIDSLEKTHMDVQRFSHTEDNYIPWAIVLLILLLLAAVIDYTLLRHIP